MPSVSGPGDGWIRPGGADTESGAAAAGDAVGERGSSRQRLARVSASADGAAGVAEPQRPLALRDHGTRCDAGGGRVSRDDPRAVCRRVVPERRADCGHAGSIPLVSPHVHGARRGPPADASCCTSARSTGRPSSPSTASRSASIAAATIRSRSTSPTRCARAAIRRWSFASGIRPTRVRSRAASRCSTREASGTPPSPASGRPCGSSPCRRHTSSACVSIRISMQASLRVTVDAFGDGAAGATARVDALDGTRVVGSATGRAGRDDRGVACRTPKLWSPADPFLYDLSVRLSTGDAVKSYFGMRKIAVGSRRSRRESVCCSTASRSSSTARSIRAGGPTASTPRRPTRRSASTSRRRSSSAST